MTGLAGGPDKETIGDEPDLKGRHHHDSLDERLAGLDPEKLGLLHVWLGGHLDRSGPGDPSLERVQRRGKSAVPAIAAAEHFPNGRVLSERCQQLGEDELDVALASLLLEYPSESDDGPGPAVSRPNMCDGAEGAGATIADVTALVASLSECELDARLRQELAGESEL